MADLSPNQPRLFVANRGEIALRVIRAAHALGIETVLGVSAADRDSPAAREAGRAVVLGPAPSRDSYLNMDLVVHAAVATGCTLLHPGYGFLSERPDFAELCAAEGLTFIGPRAETVRAVGDKISAKAVADAAKVPLTPGSGKLLSVEHALEVAQGIGYPVITKASAGGGGRGMIVARDADELRRAFDQASTTAREAFGDDTLYLEAYVERARHLEVQLFGDGEGRVSHFGERDCSIQRRYQKMIEEAPASILTDDLRAGLRAAAVDLLASINYRNAGTVEFLYDEVRQKFYFMEVNARIQVEHPVSEQISSHDLIKLQLGLALGTATLPRQDDIALAGHAIEARILAEDPDRNFMPCPGRITRWVPATGPGVRVDSAVQEGSVVPPFYDSMVAKLIVTGADRAQAVARLSDALRRFKVEGIATNIPLLQAIVDHPDYRANAVSTKWLEDTLLPAFQTERSE
ncbi:MAG: biotin carboxylase N-terminal domain-containing protein [Novosphingobium sp.]|uniref:acetyl-CoA carboxylase biotin carboxylase subunit n=1 Tax=Novosphingobium sp. TaxID=1874826 RepID=UPI002732953F|nr:biotin carboxylase N-terminal domain-containing protein [Novosphingobium sp.]MDP3550490.1 biotin carboxylase N-terminal domain-containing protein [Novosphingobium sp.]